MVAAAPDESDAALLPQPFRPAKEIAVEQWERRYLTRSCKHADGNLSRAARLAQVDRGHLRDLLRHHHIAPATMPTRCHPIDGHVRSSPRTRRVCRADAAFQPPE